MILKNTVFVLGAGASCPYKFPSGEGLATRVFKAMSDGHGIEAMRDFCGFTEKAIDEFRLALRHSGQTSVDRFLEHRPDLVEIGKAAMAYVLIKCEDGAPMLFDDHEGAWLKDLFRRMDTSFEDFGKNKVAFLTFNYDRVLEEFLCTSLCNSYKKSPDECRDQIDQIPIIHLHGKIGPLPWQSKKATRAFDPGITKTGLDIARKGIKIVHEAMDAGGDADFDKGLNLLQNAELILFLGFGYSDVNMQRLRIEHTTATARGTGFGLTSTERQLAIKASKRGLDITPHDCVGLLRNIEW